MKESAPRRFGERLADPQGGKGRWAEVDAGVAAYVARRNGKKVGAN
jgi:hypothetical protein